MTQDAEAARAIFARHWQAAGLSLDGGVLPPTASTMYIRAADLQAAAAAQQPQQQQQQAPTHLAKVAALHQPHARAPPPPPAQPYHSPQQQQQHPHHQAAAGPPVDWASGAQRVLYRVQREPSAWPFLEPVPPELVEYHQVRTQPVCLPGG